MHEHVAQKITGDSAAVHSKCVRLCKKFGLDEAHVQNSCVIVSRKLMVLQALYSGALIMGLARQIWVLVQK